MLTMAHRDGLMNSNDVSNRAAHHTTVSWLPRCTVHHNRRESVHLLPLPWKVQRKFSQKLCPCTAVRYTSSSHHSRVRLPSHETNDDCIYQDDEADEGIEERWRDKLMHAASLLVQPRWGQAWCGTCGTAALESLCQKSLTTKVCLFHAAVVLSFPSWDINF